MNRWNAWESTAPSYIVGAIGFKVVPLLFLLLAHLLDDLFRLCLASLWLVSEELDVLEIKLELELDNESDSLSCPFARRPRAWPM
jgi:hypothetical protein